MTNETPEPAPEPNIYLGADGQYHDDTDYNRENYPAAEDAPEQAADAEPVPDAEQAPVPDAPAADDAPSAKTRKA